MSYAHLAELLQTCEPSLGDLCHVLPRMPLELRKALISLARCQRRPTKPSLCHTRLREHFGYCFLLPDKTSVDFGPLCENLYLLESPIFSGFISMLARNAPFEDYGPVEEAVWSSIAKETAAATQSYPTPEFDWSPIFHPDPYYRQYPIAPGYPCDASIAGTIHLLLRKARDSLSGKTFYPEYSRKTIGYKSRRNLEQLQAHFGIHPDEKGMGSTLDLEVLYHKHGIQVCGETEIRWAWKYNDLKPRMYYARGPDVYYASRFIQPIMNTFCDSLPCTNRFTRYHHKSLTVDRALDLFIYDYESFTTLLEPIKSFTRSLANFCMGVKITIVDTSEGPREVDLGELLHEFNDICNVFPRFDRSKVEGFPQSDEFFSNHTCGMLGVPGNISSSTLLHGIHLLVIIRNLACKCVGDDAIAMGEVEDNEELCYSLSGIGKINLSKMEFWKALDQELIEEEFLVGDTTWQYVKRPIDRIGTRIITAEQYVFPSLAVMCRWEDPIHTVPEVKTEYLRLRKCCTMLCSFARQFREEVLEDEDLNLLNQILQFYLYGSGIINKKTRRPCDAVVEMRLIYPVHISNDGYFQDMEYLWWNSQVTVPVTAFDDKETYFDGLGRISKGTMLKPLKLARDLGYATVTERKRTFVVRDDPEAFLRFLAKTERPVYEYVVHEDCPDWIVHLLCSCTVDMDSVPNLAEDDEDFYTLPYDLVDELSDTE